MAKPNYQFQKRQKELQKKQKMEAKRQRKLEKNAAHADAADQPSETGAFVISRSFPVARDLLFRVWTEREHVKGWWGPKGFAVVHCTIDLRPGGKHHYGLRAPDGKELWGRFVYQEILEPEKIVWINSFSDAQGGVTRHPWNPGWPLELHSTLVLTETAGTTTATIRWAPLNPTEAERKCFEAGFASMQQGWSGTLDQLADYLRKVN